MACDLFPTWQENKHILLSLQTLKRSFRITLKGSDYSSNHELMMNSWWGNQCEKNDVICPIVTKTCHNKSLEFNAGTSFKYLTRQDDYQKKERSSSTLTIAQIKRIRFDSKSSTNWLLNCERFHQIEHRRCRKTLNMHVNGVSGFLFINLGKETLTGTLMHRNMERHGLYDHPKERCPISLRSKTIKISIGW